MKLKNPLEWFVGDRRPAAVEHLCTYMTSYTGRFFEPLAEASNANRFEATDIVAVSCLAADVPPAVAAWLLLGDGQAHASQLLEQIGNSRDCDIRQYSLSSDPAAADLWRLLVGQWDMGPTTVSKLMAAKRPHLVPIYDSYVAAALLPKDVRRWEWWAPWEELMQGADSEQIVEAVEGVRAAARDQGVEVEHLSVLRIIDIVIWRSEEQQRRERLG